MAKEDSLRFEGIVIEVLGNAMFCVKLGEGGHLITAYIGGKLRQNEIKIIAGDDVLIEMSPYDMSKGRIMYRR